MLDIVLGNMVTVDIIRDDLNQELAFELFQPRTSIDEESTVI